MAIKVNYQLPTKAITKPDTKALMFMKKILITDEVRVLIDLQSVGNLAAIAPALFSFSS